MNPRSIKAIHHGVSEEKRDSLVKIFGNELPSREFIVYVERRVIRLEDFTEEQLAAFANLIPGDILAAGLENFTEDRRLFAEEIIRRQQLAGTLHNERMSEIVNDTAADFTVQMLDGTTITLSDLRGQVVLLNFWATWCPPCIRKFHALPAMIIEPFENSEFVLLPISRGESKERVRGTMDRLRNSGIVFNTGIDSDQSIATLYGVQVLPTTVLIDKNGVVRYSSIGHSNEGLKNVANLIRKLLNE